MIVLRAESLVERRYVTYGPSPLSPVSPVPNGPSDREGGDRNPFNFDMLL